MRSGYPVPADPPSGVRVREADVAAGHVVAAEVERRDAAAPHRVPENLLAVRTQLAQALVEACLVGAVTVERVAAGVMPLTLDERLTAGARYSRLTSLSASGKGSGINNTP